MYAASSNGKRKPRRFSLIRLQFPHSANGSFSFVCLFTKKQRKFPFSNGPNGLNELAHLCRARYYFLILKGAPCWIHNEAST